MVVPIGISFSRGLFYSIFRGYVSFKEGKSTHILSATLGMIKSASSITGHRHPSVKPWWRSLAWAWRTWGHGGSPGFTQRFHKLHKNQCHWAVRTARISIRIYIYILYVYIYIYMKFNGSRPLFKWMDVAFGMRDSQIVLFYNHSPGTSETAAVWNVFSTTSDSPRLTEAGNNFSFVDVVL